MAPSDKKKEKKEDVDVLVVLGDENSGLTANKLKRVSDKGFEYRGFNYDFMMKIIEKLKDKYNFKIHFTGDRDNNYNSFVERVAKGTYDWCAGMFTHNAAREEVINYTTPILIDANAVVHLKDNDPLGEFYYVILDVIKYIVALVVIGFIFGIILYFGDPKRNIHSSRLKKSKILFFLRSIMTGISSMFGEMGYLSERSSLRVRGIIIAIIIFMIGFTLIMYIQAKMTQLLLKRQQTMYTTDNVKGKTFLGFKGYAVVDRIKRYGAKIKYVENISLKSLEEMYLANTDKYDGFILSYVDAYPLLEKNPDLIASISFGNEPNGFVMSKEREQLNTDINVAILEMKGNQELYTLCKSYFSDIESIPVCTIK